MCDSTGGAAAAGGFVKKDFTETLLPAVETELLASSPLAPGHAKSLSREGQIDPPAEGDTRHLRETTGQFRAHFLQIFVVFWPDRTFV